MENKDRRKSSKEIKSTVEANVTIDIKEYENKIHMGQNCKHYRVLYGVKQIEIAQVLNINQQEVSNIEKKEYLSMDIIKVYSNICDIGIRWLTEIPVKSSQSSYSQDGNNNINFQNNGNVEYHNHNNNPLESLKEQFNITLVSIKDELTIKREECNILQSQVKEMTDKYCILLEKFTEVFNKNNP
jgi:transcriptional regulator with XRE-family HTH domain